MIKLFTHTDLDGVGSAILANRFFGTQNVDVTYCQNGQLDNAVKQFIKEDGFNTYSKIFITDINMSVDTANILDFYNQVYNSLLLFDHHKTSEWLNRYEWATVHETVNGKLECGTSLFYKYLCTLKEFKQEAEFVEHVRQYDVWLWEQSNDTFAKDLNTLLTVLGRVEFVKRFSHQIVCCFYETEQLLIDADNRTYNNYLKKKLSSVQGITKTFPDGETYHFGIVMADCYLSQLGNKIAELHPEYDFVMLVNGNNNSLSFRTKKDHVDVSEIAKFFGGGGHPKASGGKISNTQLSNMYDALTNF